MNKYLSKFSISLSYELDNDLLMVATYNYMNNLSLFKKEHQWGLLKLINSNWQHLPKPRFIKFRGQDDRLGPITIIE